MFLLFNAYYLYKQKKEKKMNKEWIDKKNKEAIQRLEKIKKQTLKELETSPYLEEEDRKRLLKYFHNEEYYAVEATTSTLYLDYIDKSGNSTEESLKCKKWSESLELEYLRNYQENPYDLYLDSEPVEYDGDIIITDPCYLMLHNRKEDVPRPKYSDYISYEEEKDYPDCRALTEEEIEKLDPLSKILIKENLQTRFVSKMYQEERDNYEKAVSEYQLDNLSDWDLSEFGYQMDKIGIIHYMTRDTLYGDWSCTTYNTDTNEILGEFCANAGLVSVVSLDEVLKYNPGFDYHIARPWTTTWIKDFKGTVQFVVTRSEGIYEEDSYYHKVGDTWEDFSVEVVGHGINKTTGEPINFVGTQTGL